MNPGVQGGLETYPESHSGGLNLYNLISKSLVVVITSKKNLGKDFELPFGLYYRV